MNLSDQERQLIEFIREQNPADKFSVSEALEGDAWEITFAGDRMDGRDSSRNGRDA